LTGEEYISVVRKYVYPTAFAHVLGFVGEISADELEGRRGYVAGDYIGKMGIEKQMERRLRGSVGGVVVERRVDGKVIRRLREIEARKGQEVNLTIDAGLQKKVTEVLDGRKGGVVVSDAGTNEILALVSSPSFDANVFTQQIGDGLDMGLKRQEILENDQKLMFNRVLAGVYPPGSVYKMVTAIAALQEGEINRGFEMEDTGEIRVGEFRYGNWYFDQYGRLDGVLDIVKAISRSNDIFFYRIGEMVGATKLAAWSEEFGLGKLVNLSLGKQAAGVVPSPEWKENYKGEKWFLGNTYHMSIGQGDLQVTPLQVHQMASVIAGGGKLCDPSLIVGDRVKCKELEIEEDNLEIVTDGMVAACSAGGTAFPFFNFSTKQASPSGELDLSERVACKTGTAQFGDPDDRTHAWIVVFGPAEKVEILVTVLLEAAGEGSYEAGPVAKEIFDYWFHERG